jgi:hypothetical protein
MKIGYFLQVGHAESNLKTKMRYHLFLELQFLIFFGIFNDFGYILLESTIEYLGPMFESHFFLFNP